MVLRIENLLEMTMLIQGGGMAGCLPCVSGCCVSFDQSAPGNGVCICKCVCACAHILTCMRKREGEGCGWGL